jgi:MerR family transcriptional regulator, copper efflux regulator
MAEIGALLALWRDRDRPSREVRRIAEAHVGELVARIADMQAMAKTLRELVHKCHGDDRPDCPILDELAHGEEGVSRVGTPPGAVGREASEA